MPVEFDSGLVSVIVPTYNRAHTIIDTLDSVKSQTYRPIEVLIVDDGSTDNTKGVVDIWMDDNPNLDDWTIQYFYQQNTGVCSARNHALRLCHGEYIQFLDSDDLIHEDRFERVVELFERTACDYVETGFEGFYKIRGDSDEIHYGHVGIDQVAHLMKGRLWPNTLRPMYRRRLVIRTGPWNEKMITFQDYEYVIRALIQNPRTKAEAIKDVLASARRAHEPRMSDLLQTYEGRRLRIHCEKLLCEQVKQCDYISYELKQELASRIYALGFRTNVNGWPDLGKRCGEIAGRLNVKLDTKGKLRKLAWKGGWIGGKVYLAIGGLKQKFLQLRS